MTEKIDVFEIDDDFDPMEDLGLEKLDVEDEEDPNGMGTDYMPPIPDADKSVVPPKRILPPEERIENLIAGLPGQKRRLLFTIDSCREPLMLDELCERVNTEYSHSKSVYDAPQIVRLLTEAGALDKQELPAEEPEETQAPVEDAENECLQVANSARFTYTATAAGLAAVEAGSGSKLIFDILDNDMPCYLPMYRKVLEMTAADGGCTAKELDQEISNDPVCQEPRRYAGYFMGKLESADAIRWTDSWTITETGREVLNSDIFA